VNWKLLFRGMGKDMGCGCLIIIIIIFSAVGLSTGGSGYFTCKQNMKLVTTKFNPFSARGPIYRPPLCLRRMREADVSAHFFQALQ